MGHQEDLVEEAGLNEIQKGRSEGQKAAGLFRFSFLRNREDASIFRSYELLVPKRLGLQTKI